MRGSNCDCWRTLTRGTLNSVRVVLGAVGLRRPTAFPVRQRTAHGWLQKSRPCLRGFSVRFCLHVISCCFAVASPALAPNKEALAYLTLARAPRALSDRPPHANPREFGAYQTNLNSLSGGGNGVRSRGALCEHVPARPTVGQHLHRGRVDGTRYLNASNIVQASHASDYSFNTAPTLN